CRRRPSSWAGTRSWPSCVASGSPARPACWRWLAWGARARPLWPHVFWPSCSPGARRAACSPGASTTSPTLPSSSATSTTPSLPRGDPAPGAARGPGLLHLMAETVGRSADRLLLVLDGLERAQRQSGVGYGQVEDPLLKAFLLRVAEGLGQTAILITSRFPIT